MRTVLDIYKAYLHDANKEEAPAMYPSDFTHFFNKSVNQYCNKNYASFDMIQQKTDDLRNLSTFIRIDSDGVVYNKQNEEIDETIIDTVTFESGIEILLPKDYWHMLSCLVELKVLDFVCEEGNRKLSCKRLTADKYLSIHDDYFQKPSTKRAYYYIQGDKLEIRYGKKAGFVNLYIDYLKEHPEYSLTPEMITEFENNGVDISQPTGFSKYVNYEILREINTLVLARDVDPRLQTLPQVSQSIPPVGGQPQ